jgi:DNA-binding NtrC family response regulator
LASAGGDVALEVPVGVDAVAWACAYHAASPRAHGPFVVVDGTRAAATELGAAVSRPMLRAAGGTLMVQNVAALPHAAQDALAIKLSERAAAPLGEAAFAFVGSSAEPPGVLLERRELSRALAQLLIGRELSVPTLAERPEDRRGLILDRLCSSGVRRAGAPLGIDPEALQVLVDHDWPGNETELHDVIDRAARRAAGERITIADLVAAGFDLASFDEPPPAPPRFSVLPRQRSERVRTEPEPDEGTRSRPAPRRRRRR